MISSFVVITVYLADVISTRSDKCMGASLQLDNMWMPEQLQVLNLSFYSTSHVSTNQLPPTYDLHRNLLSSHLVLRQFDLAEGALAQRPDFSILVETIVRAHSSWRLAVL